MIKQVKRRLPASYSVMRSVPDDPSEEDEEDAEDDEGGYVYRLGNVPPKTHDPKRLQTDDDKINYRALCRGKDILPASIRSRLM